MADRRQRRLQGAPPSSHFALRLPCIFFSSSPNDAFYFDALAQQQQARSCRGGPGERALSTLDEMRDAGLEPGSYTYNTLIAACAPCGLWATAASLFARMQAEGVPPDHVTYNATIEARGLGRMSS